jgi:hypothetical protein
MRVLRQEQRLHLGRPRVEQSDRAQRLRVRQRLQEQIHAVFLDGLPNIRPDNWAGADILHNFKHNEVDLQIFGLIHA